MTVTSVRPHTKLAAAMVAAGVVSAASVVGVPEHLSAMSADVANASVITDALYRLGNAVDAAAYGVATAADAPISFPFDALSIGLIATQAPSLAPNLLSWLIYRYVNPSDNYLNNYTYPWAIKDGSIEPLAALLPAPIGTGIINAVNQIADAINDGLAGLPDPNPGEFATGQFWDSDIGRVINSANFALTAPVWMLYDTAYYLGYLPADLEATVESAIQNPSEIPGLISNLAYWLLSPTPTNSTPPYAGLLPSLIYHATLPLTNLPGPIGELSNNIVNAVYGGLNSLMSLLPPPITPTPFSSAMVATQFSTSSVDANSLPEASLAVASAITVPSTDPVEKKAAAADSGLPAQEPAPAAGEVDLNATDVDADTSVADKLKSGNKVKPGDKFGSQVKAETGTDDGAAVPDADEVTVDEPAADPVQTETEGADPAPAADADAAA